MLPVESPFKTYTGLDGLPLQNGYVYFGAPDQNPITVPIAVYWDEGMTQPALQPLRTLAGYIMRAGTPANVYVDGTYSILVQDAKKQQVFHVPASDKAKLRATEVSIADFGGIPDNTSIAAAAARAITYLNSVGGGTLVFGRGTYLLPNDDKIALTSSKIHIRGQGQGATILRRTGSGGTAMFEGFTTADKTDISIEDMTIDCNGTNSGIQMQYVTRFKVRNCAILNNNIWGISIGIGVDNSAVLVNKDITISDCTFSGAKNTTENLLLFNSHNVVVDNCTFADGRIGGTPALGLYQNLRGVTVSNCRFNNLHTGLYYSLSCNEVSIKGCLFSNNAVGITGANLADNGDFDQNAVFGLSISDCRFYDNDTGCGVGAVVGGSLTDCIFRGNKSNALVLSNGNAPVNRQSYGITLSGLHFINNNADGGNTLLHPGILFNGTGGTLNVSIHGCSFIDTNVTAKQLYPIGFTGAYQWSNISLFGCTLTSYTGGASIGLSGGATLANVRLYGCQNPVSLPAGVTNA